MRALSLATAAVAGALSIASPSRANVIYSFTPATIVALEPERNVSNYPMPRGGAGFSFELADAAIERGSFAVKGSGSPGSVGLGGDLEDFVSFTGPEATITPTSLRGGYASLDLTLTFDAFGNVLTGSLSHYSWNERLTFTIADNFVTGRWDSEHPACWGGCAETGALMIQNVPEPASLALLGLGLAGVLAARRRVA